MPPLTLQYLVEETTRRLVAKDGAVGVMLDRYPTAVQLSPLVEAVVREALSVMDFGIANNGEIVDPRPEVPVRQRDDRHARWSGSGRKARR